MEIQATYIDAGLLAYETVCRRKVGTRAATCDRVAGANFGNIIAALDGTGWEARTLNTVRTAIINAGLISNATWAVLGSMNGSDVMAIAFLVLMQAAKSAQEDLKSIMADVKDINDAKAKLRGLLQKLQEKSTTSPYMPWPPTIYIAA
jgi:hypothetical protein